ncbi:head maturation protease, ClpP-related [Prescottella equi]|uniref:ATP-dependent Clp protease proteolytic subunit n=1 Tax=Prescottella equi ATCC 33707 TaxID=525370 RepID=E9T079_RHOHA|nr:head maturation protease, ClpP-related [Prescottella equi]EGD24662.1 endopeptidase Clp [Prescottella equi ATCC 33707]
MSKQQWCRINALAGGGAELLIYDVIGSYWRETSAQAIAEQIKDITADEITVRINSPGGSAFDGIAIMNALRAHNARVVVHVDGLAASAASVIAMAGDEIVMGPGSQMMIHEAWVFTEGDAAFLRSEADRLDKMSDSITSLYARRAGGDFDEWRALVAAETWFTAEEAVTAGLADRIDGDAAENGDLAATFNLSRFRFAGRAQAPAPRIPSAEAVEANNRKEDDMSDLMKGLRERLGIAENADEATVLSALDEALAERADTTDIAARAGGVIVDAERFAAMQSRIAEFELHVERQQAAEVTAYLNKAVADGKFEPSKLSHYEELMKEAPTATRKLVDAMPANRLPVREVGHDGDGVGGDGSGGDIRQSAAYKALEGF